MIESAKSKRKKLIVAFPFAFGSRVRELKNLRFWTSAFPPKRFFLRFDAEVFDFYSKKSEDPIQGYS